MIVLSLFQSVLRLCCRVSIALSQHHLLSFDSNQILLLFTLSSNTVLGSLLVRSILSLQLIKTPLGMPQAFRALLILVAEEPHPIPTCDHNPLIQDLVYWKSADW